MTNDHDNVWVVVPFFNEADWIAGPITALAHQTQSEFSIVLVDNASTDGGAQVAEQALAKHPRLRGHVIREPQKGTGAAAATGFDFAIARGATMILRTDADCLPDPTWVAELVAALEAGADMVGGNLRLRRDDGKAGWFVAMLATPVYHLFRWLAPWQAENRRPELHGRFRLMPGGNLGITRAAYLRAGGFPRASIEEVHEDQALCNRVREAPCQLAFARRAIVRYSNRRTRRIGIIQMLKWYRTHDSVRPTADIR